MKIGIYGGTFDPVHIGHINLAIEMAESHNLDEIWFCPASINPHKRNSQTVKPEARLQMLYLATADIPSFKVLDIELKRPAPSYTIDTLRYLQDQQQYLNLDQFYLIIGADAAPHFHLWHKAEEIVDSATLLVGRRSDDGTKKLFESPKKIQDALQNGLTTTRIIDVSSTEIRKRLSQNLYCGHLLHIKVLDYILSHHLYCSSDH
jgi:nicotinate-nucleotide adenylyltransferase